MIDLTDDGLARELGDRVDCWLYHPLVHRWFFNANGEWIRDDTLMIINTVRRFLREMDEATRGVNHEGRRQLRSLRKVNAVERLLRCDLCADPSDWILNDTATSMEPRT